jgi:hypothetical protein
MTSKLLPVIRATALIRLSDAVPLVQRGRFGENGRIAELVVELYRTVGICDLLHDGSRDAFLANLQRSGTACAFALPHLPRESVATSKLGGFFSAAACGDGDTARAIARQARDTWNSDIEHEDDFLYARFLMELFFLGATKTRLLTLADRLSEVTDGEPSALRDICRASLAKDSAQFEEGLESLLAQRRAVYRDQWEYDQITEEEWATEGQISVECIALVKLARKLGLTTQREYLFVPALALDLDVQNAPPDSWRSVPS